MNELIQWVKDGKVQNGYVDGATKEVVETSDYIPAPEDADRVRVLELKAKADSLSASEQEEAVSLMLKLWS